MWLDAYVRRILGRNSFKRGGGGGERERENVKPRENPNFLKKKSKMVISVKIRNFSRSRMTKQTSPLESSREI